MTMGRLIFTALAILGILLAAPWLWSQSGLGGVAGLVVILWAALMVYLIGLIVVRLKRGMGSSEQLLNVQLAQFLAAAEDANQITGDPPDTPEPGTANLDHKTDDSPPHTP